MKRTDNRIKKFRVFTSFRIAILIVFLIPLTQVFAGNETFTSGAYIVDMGQSPQTIANGLKPYGLVYDLIMNENVPISWAISTTKGKDGIDFSVGGVNYKGGTFIIPSEYADGSVVSVINTWRAKGVVVNGPIGSSFIAPVYDVLTSWPKAVLDDQNDSKVVPFYTNAEIPTSSYTTAGNPTMLTSCGDVYVMPHADPHNWSEAWQQALLDYVIDGGYLWAACHAVSSLETMVDIDGDGNPDCDFLSDGGLIEWDDHNDGTPPYTYSSAHNSDPVMQFMGTLDNATQNGSEQIFMPPLTGSWRGTTQIAVYDPDHSQANAGDAAVVAYGPAFGNSSYGYVMYEGGHELNKGSATVTSRVAAQRAYFNFLLYAGDKKQIQIASTVPTSIPSASTVNVSAVASGGNSPYTYLWTSSCGGTFANATSASTTFTAPTVGTETPCVVQVMITDNCDRFSYSSTPLIISVLTGPTAVDDNAATDPVTPVDITVLSNDVAGSGALDPTTVIFIGGTAPNPTTEGTYTVNGTTGVVTFTPVSTFAGDATIDYQVCDVNSLCDIATITVTVSAIVGPTAVNNSAFTAQDVPVDIDVLSNDVAGTGALDPTTVTFVGGTTPNATTVGTFTVDGTTGLVTFTPVAAFSGVTTVDYQVCDVNSLCDDATITVTVTASVDCDSDGVPDSEDDYPCDPVRAFDHYYPANGDGTLAYEDLWPGQGDYDFNDLVTDYRFHMVTNASNNLVEIFADFTIKAFGASLHNGFGFQFANDNINQSHLNVTGHELTAGFISNGSNGLENGQERPTIILWEDYFDLMQHPGTGIGVNTTPGAPYVTPETINIFIEFTGGTYTLSQLDIEDFNPFLIVNLVRGHEIHLPDYEPTTLVDESLFGTVKDNSNASTGRYYKTTGNLPWAINIYESFDYPKEKIDIITVYHHFVEWASGGGVDYLDWYQDNPGYRDNSKIY